MRKNIFIFSLLFFFIHLLIADINEYKYDIIKEIGTGYIEKELLGYVKGMPPSGPTCFVIHNSKIYINDNQKSRMVIFNKYFHFLVEIKVDKYLFAGVNEMIIDPNNNIYLDVMGNNNITKITPEGNILFEIPRIIEMSHEHFYFINNYTFYYDNNKKICYIDDKGNLFKQGKALEILKKQEGWMKGFFTGTPHENKFKTFLNNNDLIYINSKLYVRDIITFEQYVSMIKANFKGKKFIKDIHNQNMTNIWISTFRGFDNKNNYYFEGHYEQGNRGYVLLLVYSTYGQLLDYFYNPIGIGYKIALNGDIWGMSPDEEYVRFSKITAAGRWRFDTTEPIDTSSPPKALTITATSFIDWKNTYTPTKAFDNNLNTGWLEAAKGPGTGESITLKLNRVITVDEIHIAPGYFDPKWWKSNNRVKDLRVIYGNKSLVLHFKDVMQMQKAKLNKDIHFSDITFEIMGVFPSGKDNDAGISEIEFYYKGKKVEIDMSGVK